MIILSILSNASGFSILAIIGILALESLALESLSMRFFNAIKSLPSLTKDKAIQSTSKEIANFTSLMSFAVNEEEDIFVFGRLIPFLDRKYVSFTALIVTLLFLSVVTTENIYLPSSIST